MLSRNLTFDRCWDVALASEAAPAGKRHHAATRDLSELLRTLPDLAVNDLDASLVAAITALADEAARTVFPCPEGLGDKITFQALGLGSPRRKPWHPREGGSRLLAIAPFANRTALDTLAGLTSGERTLVSRQETLDALPEDVLAPWGCVLVLSEAAAAELDDASGARPSGLHAKVIGIEHGYDVTWFVGSANLTAAAFTGHNVEMMAAVTGKKGRKGGQSGSGIERFGESGFLALCELYRRSVVEEESRALTDARTRLEAARRALLDGELHVRCTSEDASWTWRIEGDVAPPEDVDVVAWPVSLAEDQARRLELPSLWILPASRLTAFVAFRLCVRDAGVDDMRFTLKLSAEGLPEERIHQVLRTLIDSPERFLRFLRALLGGLEGLADWSVGEESGSGGGRWGVGMDGETLLEDLVRTASRDPERLVPVRRLIADLRRTEEGCQIVPDDLFAVWSVVDRVLGVEETP